MMKVLAICASPRKGGNSDVLCEHICPQHLPIRELLTEVAKEFDK